MEPVYDVAASDDGTKGQVLSNSEAMGKDVFQTDWTSMTNTS
jgi:hypothetical protein